jgi:hypothetical protein
VFAAKVTTPLESTLNGPVVIGVTSVLAAVTATRLRYHLLLHFKPSIAAVAPVTTVVNHRLLH